MSIIVLEAEVRQLLGRFSRASEPDQPSVDNAWLVLEAANDIGDEPAIQACRRVIDADLNGRLASESDLRIIHDFFR